MHGSCSTQELKEIGFSLGDTPVRHRVVPVIGASTNGLWPVWRQSAGTTQLKDLIPGCSSTQTLTQWKQQVKSSRQRRVEDMLIAYARWRICNGLFVLS